MSTLLAPHVAEMLRHGQPAAGTLPVERTLPTRVASDPAAAQQAEQNWAANREALRRTQPDVLDSLAITSIDDLAFAFGRDKSLTARDAAGGWWAGNSVPRRAAIEMAKLVGEPSAPSCLLAPPHGAQLPTVRDRLDPSHALLVVQPDWRTLKLALHTADVSPALAAGQLWFAAGATWADGLRRLLETQTGVPVPTRFLRLPDVGDEADALIADAQPVLAAEMARRSALLTTNRYAPRPIDHAIARIGVLAPTRFRLWHDAPAALLAALHRGTPQHAPIDWMPFDADRPDAATPLALQVAARDWRAFISADAGRADRPDVLPIELPWGTWITTPRVPAFAAAGPRDWLMLADESWQDRAAARGWPADRIEIAGWPSRSLGSTNTQAGVALIADVHDLTPPKSVEAFSSHRLLWESIAAQLTAKPLALGADISAFLADAMDQAGIDATQPLDRALFIDGLIIPAYQVGLARALVAAKVPVQLHGRGWETITSLASHARGPIVTRQAFDAVAASASAFIRPWPFDASAQLYALGRPVLTANAAGKATAACEQRAAPHPLSAATVLNRLGL